MDQEAQLISIRGLFDQDHRYLIADHVSKCRVARSWGPTRTSIPATILKEAVNSG
jgi:hypothetical protein